MLNRFYLTQIVGGTFKNCSLHPRYLLFFFKLSIFCFLPKDSLPSGIGTPRSNVSFMMVLKQKMTGLALSFLSLQVSPCMLRTAPELFISPSLSVHWETDITKAGRFFFTVISARQQYRASEYDSLLLSDNIYCLN